MCELALKVFSRGFLSLSILYMQQTKWLSANSWDFQNFAKYYLKDMVQPS